MIAGVAAVATSALRKRACADGPSGGVADGFDDAQRGVPGDVLAVSISVMNLYPRHHFMSFRARTKMKAGRRLSRS
jgi:hypothetical protein